jgi:riboflavin kinase / FMN adenylyltransferase
MNLVHTTADLDAGARPVCLAIGVFDGVHLGHQQVIRQAVGDAAQHGGLAVVITFDRHPNAVVAPTHVPPLIYPLAKKLRVIASLGAETACVLRFDKAFSEIPGEEFIRGLWRDCRPIHSISVGGSFTFGWRRSGNVALLKSLGNELGFAVHGLAEISLDGHAVSSTRVREAVQQGRFDLAGQMLGRPYALCGKVVQGAGLGHQIGVPTANLDLTGLLLPPNGVYAARALVRGETHLAAVNVGSRPTVGSAAPQIQVEAHLLDFVGDIYEEEIELIFLTKLREEHKFPSLAALQEQILLDIAQVRSFA